MKHEQEWFEMRDRRARFMDRSAWTPLRSARKEASPGKWFADGHQEEHFCASSAAFPVSTRSEVEREIGWGQLSLMHDHAPYAQDDEYTPADRFVLGDLQGTYLVLSQRGNSAEHGDWLLHPDLILGLRLKREGDVWLAMDEGYLPVVRMTRGEKGYPDLLEIRTSHLKDFLAARREFLCVSTYASREEVADDASSISWPENSLTEKWNQQDLDARLRIAPPAIFTFTILRDGTIKDIRLKTSSGNTALDRSGERALYDVGRVDPLPAGYDRDRAEIEYWFVLKR